MGQTSPLLIRSRTNQSIFVPKFFIHFTEMKKSQANATMGPLKKVSEALWTWSVPILRVGQQWCAYDTGTPAAGLPWTPRGGPVPPDPHAGPPAPPAGPPAPPGGTLPGSQPPPSCSGGGGSRGRCRCSGPRKLSSEVCPAVFSGLSSPPLTLASACCWRNGRQKTQKSGRKSVFIGPCF